MTDFLWGSATAAYQCEGAWHEEGKGLSIWDDYSHSDKCPAHVENGDTASDHYHKFEEDFKMMKEGGQNSYRFSFSWPRIMPDGTGKINPQGVSYYHKMIATMRQYGIEPNVTLYHWDLPLSLHKKGGWENIETAFAFAEYAKFCFHEFGDSVKLWATLNEPFYSLLCMYGSGNYPPNVKDAQRLLHAAYIQMYASALAANEFRKLENIGQLGIVADIHPCYGVDDSEACQFAVQMADHIMNNWVLDTAFKGYFPQQLLDELAKQYDLSFMKEEHRAIFDKGTLDFVGLNYYNRAYIRPYTTGESFVLVNNSGSKNSGIREAGKVKRMMVVKNMFEKIADPNGTFTEWDFEIYPKGIYDAVKMVQKKYGDLPIYITENGIGLHEKLINHTVDDTARISFMQRHIDELLKAKKEGVAVMGYYVWSTFDLYSWINGYDKRYGLVYVDFAHENKRYPKQSYVWYKNFINNWRELYETKYGH